jgi:hypothetical protein
MTMHRGKNTISRMISREKPTTYIHESPLMPYESYEEVLTLNDGATTMLRQSSNSSMGSRTKWALLQKIMGYEINWKQ